jgi:hypothetical protein
MARTNTPIVTVVQGDDGPDIVATIQQDASGDVMVLTNRKAFVVLVDRADSSSYIAKWDAFIEDSSAGKIRISWIKDYAESTSYLDDLTPGARYELQLFLGRTDLPPSFINFNSFYTYFNGQFDYTGANQEGAPIFKSGTEDLYLSRSAYDGNGNPDEYVWLVTSLRAATWDEVKGQDKAILDPADLATTPIWNYRQVLNSTNAPNFIINPMLDVFETSGDFVITPDDKYTVLSQATSTASGDVPASTYYESGTVATFWYDTIDGVNPQSTLVAGISNWSMFTIVPSFIEVYDNPSTDTTTVPTSGWAQVTGASPVPTFGPTTIQQYCIPDDVADQPADVEGRGTQTVLTRIPIAVKPAYRLAPVVEVT